jgi:protein ImuB
VLVIVRTIANRQLVTAVSVSAAKRGIRPGMTLAQARALCAEVEHEEHEPHRDAVALEALARWMIRFSPRVSLPLPGENRETGLWIDLTGTRRLHGPPEQVAQIAAAALTRWGFSARLAIGPTPGAAWAATYADGRDGEMQRQVDEVTDRGRAGDCRTSSPRLWVSPPLSSLPIHSLRLPHDIVAALHHLGIRTVQQLQRLPRDELPSRFGPILLTRLDQAMGLLDEPLLPVRPGAPIVAARRWDEPVENLELIWPVAKELIETITSQLLRRGQGAREVEATLSLAQGAAITRTIRLSRPSRDGRKILDLLQRAVEGKGSRDGETERRRNEVRRRGDAYGYPRTGPRTTSSLRLSVSWSLRSISSPPTDLSPFDHNGFIAIRLEVTRWQPMSTEQITLGGGAEFEGRVELDDLVERLRVRLGDRAVIQPRPVAAHLPESAVALDCEASSDSQCTMRNPQFPAPPLWVHRPMEVRVIVSPSHDRDGRPVMVGDPFTQQPMAIRHAVGPTRVAGQWWTGHDKSRDYFDVELPDGRRWWVFRVNETGRWFWQGEY